MKPPKLPGAEKLKFFEKRLSPDDTRSTGSSGSTASGSDCLPSPAGSMFIRGQLARSTCPPAPCSTNGSHLNRQVEEEVRSLTFNRTDSRRRAILPISSRMTSRVLTLTDLPLDSFDIRDYHQQNSFKRTEPTRAPSTSCDSSSSSSSLINGYVQPSMSQASSPVVTITSPSPCMSSSRGSLLSSQSGHSDNDAHYTGSHLSSLSSSSSDSPANVLRMNGSSCGSSSPSPSSLSPINGTRLAITERVEENTQREPETPASQWPAAFHRLSSSSQSSWASSDPDTGPDPGFELWMQRQRYK